MFHTMKDAESRGPRNVTQKLLKELKTDMVIKPNTYIMFKLASAQTHTHSSNKNEIS